MQKISDSTNTANAAGEFTEGNPAAGVDSTLIKAVWLNSIQREIIALIVGAGLSLNKNDDSQVLKAVKALLAGAEIDFSKIKNLPTTRNGYGLTDVPTKSEMSTAVSERLKAGAVNNSAGTILESKLARAIGTSGWDAKTALTVSNGGDTAASAVMTFLRDNSHGFHLGIDTDNKFKRGGVSFGANSYEIWDELSLPLATQAQAEAGTNGKSVMTPIAVAQAITKQVVAASETAPGIAAIASQAAVSAGTDDQRFVTAKKLQARLAAWFAQATETVLGAVRLATQVQVDNGIDDTSAVTPSKLKALFDVRGLWQASKTLADANANPDTGIYASSNANGAPPGTYQVINTRYGGDTRWLSQLFLGISSNRAFFRSKGSAAGLETPLVELHHTGNMAMVGASVGFYLRTAPPGFLKENGAAVSRTVYADLFAVIGVGFGAGDGSTTFNLPDHRAEFPRGLDDGRGVNPGRTVGSTEGQSIQSHDHIILNMATSFNFSAAAGGGAPGAAVTGVTQAAGGAETRPRSIAKLYCIKY